jgi:hypothetical protein
MDENMADGEVENLEEEEEARSRSAFWCVRGVKHRHTIFHAQVGLVQIPQKARRDTFHQTCVFA